MSIITSPTNYYNLFPNKTSVTVDFTSATWNTIATHEVFTVTGLVRCLILPRCTENMAAGAGGTMKLGIEGVTNDFVVATLFSAITADTIWLTATPAQRYNIGQAFDKLNFGLDIGYEIETAAFTDGTMVFDCLWLPISDNGNVVAGAGGAL